jgi:hypothetical protein
MFKNKARKENSKLLKIVIYVISCILFVVLQTMKLEEALLIGCIQSLQLNIFKSM